MSRVVSFNSLKGGVGKTTSAILFINQLVTNGKKTLIIDLDPQYSLTTYYLEGNPDVDKSLFKYLTKWRARLKDCVVPIRENLDLLSSTPDMINFNTHSKYQKDPLKLRKKLTKDKAFLDYEYIIIDTPPTFSFVNLLSFSFVDYVFLITLPEIWSIRAISVFMNQMKIQLSEIPSHIEDVFLLLNFYKKSVKAEQLIADSLKKKFPDLLLDQTIPYSRALMNNILYKKKNDRYVQPIEEIVQSIIKEKLG